MGAKTNIEWCDHTFNPWEGCQKVGPGCDHCYAERRNARFHRGQAVNWGPAAPRSRTSNGYWKNPERWQRQAAAFMAEHGRRQRVFCASLADVFDNQVPSEWRDDLWSLIQATPDLDWLLLTKRIGNVGNMLPVPFNFAKYFPNVWIGATITSQAEADRDIRKLLALPVRVRFLSMEPLLGPVNLTCIPVGGGHGHHEFDPIITGNVLHRPVSSDPSVHWVIVGGESGKGARPMHPDWARSLRDQCADAGVPFLFKQWGSLVPSCQDQCPWGPPHKNWVWADGNPFHADDGNRAMPLFRRVPVAVAGRELDGVLHEQFPEVP
jgi:protein gp37